MGLIRFRDVLIDMHPKTSATPREYARVFMDMQMPLMDVIEAIRWISDNEVADRAERAPIIAMTANALPYDRIRCLDAGMDDHIVKPINTQQLIEKLRREFSNKDPSYNSPIRRRLWDDQPELIF